MKPVHWQFLKYLAVGALNSAIGLSCIFGCMKLGLNDVLSNAIGYIVGFFISYSANSRWTFNQRKTSTSTFVRFLSVTCVAYACNVGVLLAARHIVHFDRWFSQMLGVVTYTLVGFVGSRVFAFRAKNTTTSNIQV
jgi:putative flippase GtrA